MLPILAILLPSAAILAYLVNWYRCFRRNIQTAKASGIPYVIVPAFPFNGLWMLTHGILIKWLSPFVPASWVESCLDYTKIDQAWKFGHKLFERLGSDTYLTVSGGPFTLWTADADVISQITGRRNDFPKPGDLYYALNIYGRNVVTTEGSEWRRHRKLVSPTFGERNNQLVWAETLDQGQKMLDSWVGKGARLNTTVSRMMDDTMRLSLHVISRAGFGRKLEWPEEEAEHVDEKGEGPPLTSKTAQTNEHGSKIQNSEDDRDKGHSMSFVYALHCLMLYLPFILFFPHSLLKWSPAKAMRTSYEAYSEWAAYMKEMVSSKTAAVKEGKALNDMDIVGQLIKGQNAASAGKSPNGDRPLSDSEILGNAFVMILAGHETAAGTIHSAIVLLALNAAVQRNLQSDLDAHFKGRPPSAWDYDKDLSALLHGMTGAVMNEVLRVYCPVINIPKSTFGVGDQPITVNGKSCTIPKETYINCAVASLHRNPKWWPTAAVTDQQRSQAITDNPSGDLDEFIPARWVMAGGEKRANTDKDNSTVTYSTAADTNDDDDADSIQDFETGPSLYHPPKGTFMAFSEGARACIGRRFAQVEILAALALIFAQYSVELAVDKYASDAEVDAMDPAARKVVWQKAADDAYALIRASTTIVTLQIRTGYVPVRFVRKGDERFAF